MTAKTLEQEALVYALEEAKSAQKRHGLTDLATAMYMEALAVGYLAAAAARDKEVEELRARVKELEAQVDDCEEKMSHVPAGFFA